MLVISRRIGESFIIGENIVATVVDITGEKVILGIEAPRDIPIARTEPTGEKSAINERGYARQYKKARSPGDVSEPKDKKRP